jgi:hypothetical protein
MIWVVEWLCIAVPVRRLVPGGDSPDTAPPRIYSFSSCLSRLICPNSSTLDRAIPDLHADDIDVKIRTRVGPTFRDDTLRPPAAGSH